MLHLVKSDTEARPDVSVATVGRVDRFAVVARYGVLDTQPEAAFDRITALAADLFDAPIAIIGFVGRDQLWFKSHHGMDATGISWGPDAPVSAIAPRIRREFDLGFFVSVPLRTPDGFDLGTLCVIDREPRQAEPQKIRQLERLADIVVDHMELRLAKFLAIARANLMGSEVDHRAMNSLQLVASLLHLQSRAAGGEVGQQLTTAANRVLAVARVHRTFSADETADRVPVLAYLRRLCGELSESLDATIAVDGGEGSVPKTQILAIGLIVNELATNAKKHAEGTITVTFSTRADGQCELCVFDHGKGLPEGFSLDRSSRGGLGMRVIDALVAQLSGKLLAGPRPAGRGACFAVMFPAA